MSGPESRFTAPTALCPSPSWWTSDDESDATENEVTELVFGLVRGLQPRYCLETGTAFGNTSVRIGEALAANGHGALVTIERDRERRQAFLERAAGLDLPIMAYGGSSLDWESEIADLVFDFCWFDSHFSLRVPEFLHFRRWMRPGTVVCFHDTAPGHGGAWADGSDVRSVIARELRPKLRMVHLPTPRGLTIGEVLP